MNRNLLATILIIAAIGVYFTITKPMIADVQAVRSQNEQYSAALASADEIIKARESITRSYNSISQDNRTRLDKMIPSAVDNIRLVIDLNNLALQHHFALSDVKASVPSNSSVSGPRGTAQAPGASLVAAAGAIPSLGASSGGQNIAEPVLDKVQVSFTAQTTYDQFISFLQALESDLRIMDLTHLVVGVNEDGTYTFQAQLQTYWLRQ